MLLIIQTKDKYCMHYSARRIQHRTLHKTLFFTLQLQDMSITSLDNKNNLIKKITTINHKVTKSCFAIKAHQEVFLFKQNYLN